MCLFACLLACLLALLQFRNSNPTAKIALPLHACIQHGNGCRIEYLSYLPEASCQFLSYPIPVPVPTDRPTEHTSHPSTPSTLRSGNERALVSTSLGNEQTDDSCNVSRHASFPFPRSSYRVKCSCGCNCTSSKSGTDRYPLQRCKVVRLR